MFFKTGSIPCSTRICAFALIPFMEDDIVIQSISVISFTLRFKEGSSSFATHCFAFARECFFYSRVCSSDSDSLSAFLKEDCSSSALAEEDVVTSMGVVWTTSLILSSLFSVTLSLEKRSAAVLTESAMIAILKSNCNT